MNIHRKAEEELLDSTLELNLHLSAPSVAPVYTVAAGPDRLTGNHRADGKDAEATTLPNASSFSETSTALYHLLMRYVDLLEGQGHGGWTLDEEATVRAAVAALSRSGWQTRLPRALV